MNLDNLGGRKFVLTVVCVAVGTAVELYTSRGVTPAFAGLLGTLVAAFGAANAFNTQQYLANGANLVDSKPDPVAPIDFSVLDAKFEEVAHKADSALALANGVSDSMVHMATTIENAKKLAQAAIRVNGG